MSTNFQNERFVRVQSILKAIPDDLLMVDGSGNVLEYKAGSSSLHIPMDNFLGTHLSELTSGEKLAELLTQVRLCISKMPTKEVDVTLGEKVFEARFVDVEAESAMMLFRDVTAEKELERLKADFLAAVSHELNTPLASILGFTELLIDGDYPLEERRLYLDRVRHSTLRLKEIVGNLLDSSRLESGHFEVRLEPIRVNPMVTEVAESFIGLARISKKEYRIQIEPSTLLFADSNRLAQVVGNLLSNAFKFCPVEGVVTVNGSRRNKGYLVFIHNSGEQIPLAEREDLFTRYGRTKSANSRGIVGNGLGLYISKAIVEAHHGRIWLDPGAKEGTRFCIWLPEIKAQVEGN